MDVTSDKALDGKSDGTLDGNNDGDSDDWEDSSTDRLNEGASDGFIVFVICSNVIVVRHLDFNCSFRI